MSKHALFSGVTYSNTPHDGIDAYLRNDDGDLLIETCDELKLKSSAFSIDLGGTRLNVTNDCGDLAISTCDDLKISADELSINIDGASLKIENDCGDLALSTCDDLKINADELSINVDGVRLKIENDSGDLALSTCNDFKLMADGQLTLSASSIHLDGPVLDRSRNPGYPGKVLSSIDGGVQWKNLPDLLVETGIGVAGNGPDETKYTDTTLYGRINMSQYSILRLNGKVLDYFGQAGSAGQVLTTDGLQTRWDNMPNFVGPMISIGRRGATSADDSVTSISGKILLNDQLFNGGDSGGSYTGPEYTIPEDPTRNTHFALTIVGTLTPGIQAFVKLPQMDVGGKFITIFNKGTNAVRVDSLVSTRRIFGGGGGPNGTLEYPVYANQTIHLFSAGPNGFMVLSATTGNRGFGSPSVVATPEQNTQMLRNSVSTFTGSPQTVTFVPNVYGRPPAVILTPIDGANVALSTVVNTGFTFTYTSPPTSLHWISIW